VLELAEGGTLKDMIKRNKVLLAEEISSIICQIILACDFLH
jgi:serine/threonine protein kinase